MARESDVNAPGGGHDLRNYWVRGEGAVKIGWGTDGSFARCVSHLGKHVKNPQGLCAEYHKAATGEWPAEKGVESVGDTKTFDIIDAHGNKHSPTDGKFVKKSGGGSSFDPTDDDRSVSGHRKRMRKLEDKLEGDEGLSESEHRELKKLRSAFRAKSSVNDDDNDAGYDDDDDASSSGESFDGVADADDVISKLKNSGAPRRSNLEWTGEDDADPASEIAATLRDLINEDITEDSAEDRLKYAGLDMSEIDLDYLANLYESEFGSLTSAAVKRKRRKMNTYADEPWEGTLVVEGVESGDSRMFGLGSLDWAELPMPLQYQPANIGGHNGSITVGEITHVARRSNELYGWGNIFGTSLNSEHGDGIRNTMKVGGVSVDVDDVKDAEVEMIFADSEGGSNPFAKPEMTVFHKGRVRGATMVPFPAFVEAKLKFTGVLAASAEPKSCGCEAAGDLTENSRVLIAAGAVEGSSHTITIPNLPPAHWFSEPTDVVSYGALTITDEGRVFGVVAPADTTHRSVKTKVPRNLDFSRFLKGETIVAGGGRVVTGVVTANCGHAATQNYGTLNNRLEHYDNSCSVLANVNVGYARDGAIWFAGALNAGAEASQVAQALGCSLSLDVQPHPDRAGIREFIAAHLVPVPGFPLARTKASVLYNDGVITAASVPVGFTDDPVVASVDTYALARSVKLMLAESIGRDPAARKRALLDSLGR